MAYSSTKTLIKPLRNHNEHDVIPYFSLDASSSNKGVFVKAAGNGMVFEDSSTTWAGGITSAGDVGASYAGVFAQRYSTTAKCSAASTGDAGKILGVLLYDVRETDENGDRLVNRPKKAMELQAVVSGQANSILTRGEVLYFVTGSVTAGAAAYIDTNGEVNSNDAVTGSNVQVGRFLGAANSDGYALLKIEL